MRKIVVLIAAAVMAVSLVSCELLDKENDVDEIKYEYLYDCMWSWSESSPYRDEMPAYASDPDYPILFTTDNKMVWMHFDGTNYTYTTHFSFSIDRKKGCLYLTSEYGVGIMLQISALNSHHLTMLFGGNEYSYACYERLEFPEGAVDMDSFPEGLQI